MERKNKSMLGLDIVDNLTAQGYWTLVRHNEWDGTVMTSAVLMATL
jgi:hypothetical protein